MDGFTDSPSIEVWTENRGTFICKIDMEKERKSIPSHQLLSQILSILAQQNIVMDRVALKRDGELLGDNYEVTPGVVYLVTLKDHQKIVSYNGIDLIIPLKENPLLYACDIFGLVSSYYKINEKNELVWMMPVIPEEELIMQYKVESEVSVIYNGETYKMDCTNMKYQWVLLGNICGKLGLVPGEHQLIGGITADFIDPKVKYILVKKPFFPSIK